MQPFVHLAIVFCWYTALQNRSRKIIKFPCLPYFWGYFVEAGNFSAFNFIHTMLCFSSINCLSRMSSWQLNFVIGLSVTLGEFPSRFLKYSFHVCIRFSWQLLVLLSTSSSFGSVHLRSFMLFVIVYLQPDFLFHWSGLECIFVDLFGMYKLVLCFFLCSWAFKFAGFLLLSMDSIFMSSCCFLCASDSHQNVQLSLALVGMHSAAVFMWAVMKIS